VGGELDEEPFVVLSRQDVETPEQQSLPRVHELNFGLICSYDSTL
jgi:hypothetical protein